MNHTRDSILKNSSFKDKGNKKSKEERYKEETKGLSDFYQLRMNWSRYIRNFITVILSFQFLLVVALFRYQLSKDVINLIYFIVVETFLQIMGMGYIVVKFLYPKNSKN